ncbi:MAG: acetyl-CoA carboxylase biotin carboxyl carrier protein [Gemmatimonadetes bacterium]|nr:acetyl-CoA carboxylase biotin carboxyl carrier protein [Gemmatimonadota bacterium]
MDLDFLERLIQAVDESSIDSIEIERGGTRVRIGKTPPQTVAAAAPVAPPLAAASPAAPAPITPASTEASAEPVESGTPSHWIDVPSPMVGTFYRAPAPDAPAYVDVGSRVGEGDTLCIIEAMKLMNELEAEASGTLAEICVENGEPVEYGQILFRIDPS